MVLVMGLGKYLVREMEGKYGLGEGRGRREVVVWGEKGGREGKGLVMGGIMGGV